MLALLSAALFAASSITTPEVMDAPAPVVNYFGMEDITPVPTSGTGYVLRGEATLITGSRTIMYDLAGRKSNGDLSFASPRTSGTKKWNWYSTGMFTTVSWY